MLDFNTVPPVPDAAGGDFDSARGRQGKTNAEAAEYEDDDTEQGPPDYEYGETEMPPFVYPAVCHLECDQ